MTIGQATRARSIELCNQREISLNHLADMSGVTQSTVNSITSGRNNSATGLTIQKLCDGLGISVREFFDSDLFKTWNRRSNSRRKGQFFYQ